MEGITRDRGAKLNKHRKREYMKKIIIKIQSMENCRKQIGFLHSGDFILGSFVFDGILESGTDYYFSLKDEIYFRISKSFAEVIR